MEIRFRVWDGKKMWYSALNRDWIICQDGYLVSMVVDGEISHSSDAIPMLSTGLKDKNGKEIWEGDICGLGTYPGSVVEIADFLGHHYWLKQESGRDIEYSVIGNIHENPELLEEVA